MAPGAGARRLTRHMSLGLDTITGRFADRRAAGRELGRRLGWLAGEDPVVFGLARGGVPVAYEVAETLGAPLDVLVVRKIGAPGNPELGIGAVAEGNVQVLDPDAVRRMLMSVEELDTAIARARAEVQARVDRYRDGLPLHVVRGRTAIVVDDGLATGGTARAALRAIRAQGPSRLVLAVPVGAAETVHALREEADMVVCVLQPETFWAVGLWYEHFEQIADAEVAQLLAGGVDDPPPPRLPGVEEVRVPVAEIVGDLVVPKEAQGLVVVANGSGSSRFSSRNRDVAGALHQRGLATLLLDLLRHDEERDRTNVFDISLLSQRLVATARWARTQPGLAELPIGYLATSTGAAAAFRAAAELPDEVGAVVSYAGRPDLATRWLQRVCAPVLLIVGEHDKLVHELNREAQLELGVSCALAVIPCAGHRFEEPGALEEVTLLAGDWFERHLVPAVVPQVT
jgi:putative phosphoribosyl transferase